MIAGEEFCKGHWEGCLEGPPKSLFATLKKCTNQSDLRENETHTVGLRNRGSLYEFLRVVVTSARSVCFLYVSRTSDCAAERNQVCVEISQMQINFPFIPI